MPRWVGFVCWLLALNACANDASSGDPYANDIRAHVQQVQQFLSGNTPPSSRLPSLAQIYSPRNFAPLWIRDGAPTAQAIALIRVLCSAENYGLRSVAYLDCPRFEQLLGSPRTPDQSPPLANAEFDMGLTTVALRFLNDIHFGRVDPRQAGFDISFERPPLSYGRILSELSTASDIAPVLASLEPSFTHYLLLKESLARYRSLASGQAVATPAELRSAPYDRRIRQIELTLERRRRFCR